MRMVIAVYCAPCSRNGQRELAESPVETGAGLRRQRAAPRDLLSLARLHLLKVPHLSKAAPPTQEQVFTAWTWGGHVQTSDNVENAIISPMILK